MIKFQTTSRIWSPDEIKNMLSESLSEDMLIKTTKKLLMYNAPASFDIETTSFTQPSSQLDQDEEKVAVMYEWTLGINGQVMIGRTWKEFLDVCEIISSELNLMPDQKHLIVYVHNLAFEFQAFCKRFTWHKIFSIKQRKPIYAVTMGGIEFRCSYMLSGYSLQKLPEELTKYPVEKMVGDLDYSLMRHSETPLTAKELKYCENDVRVVMAYIQETIERDGNITKIPLTKTGYVRNYCRNMCMYEGSHKKNVGKYKKWRQLMKSLTLDADEYRQAKRAFQGGFTHANVMYAQQVVKNVRSFDFASSYPYTMVAEQFPMSKGKKVKINSIDEFRRYLKLYCCMFDIIFYNLKASVLFENPMSVSRCPLKQNAKINNGRIVSADMVATTITEQDFEIFEKFYTWEHMEIHNFRIYERGYLPTDFVRAILKLYNDKTTLKGVEGQEVEYLLSKGMLNACYGMAVTDICRDENIYDDGVWSKEIADPEEEIEKYNKSLRRFLFYPWGVWVTAYARRNLFSGIWEFGEDYVYSDTDSIKAVNAERHMKYIEAYNRRVRKKLERAMLFHGLDISLTEPENVKGEKQPMGVWDDEGVYELFKTLGAKRYLVKKNGKYALTVAGVNKKSALNYMVKQFGDCIFDAFDDDLEIPAEHSGKLTHTYIDDVRTGCLVDYTGKPLEFTELSGTHLEPAPYHMSMAMAYLDYIMGVREHER